MLGSIRAVLHCVVACSHNKPLLVPLKCPRENEKMTEGKNVMLGAAVNGLRLKSKGLLLNEVIALVARTTNRLKNEKSEERFMRK